MSRVALIRGPFLNPYDMAPFHHLDGEFEAYAVAARRCLTESETTGLDVRRLRCPETEAPLRVARAVNRGPWFLGRGYSLLGLADALEGADVVHTAERYFGFSLQAAAVAARRGLPLVVTVKETIADIERLHPVRRLGFERVTKRRVDAVTSRYVAVSAAAACALEQEGVEAERISIVPPAVDVGRFAAAEREAARSMRALFVGPALWRKGLIETVRAIAVARRRLPVELTIAGTGPDLRLALDLAGELGIREHVHTLGRVPHADMPGVYAQADVLVAPSIPTRTWQEQDSMAVLEAMAAGIPVVATPGGVRRELLGDEGHWVAPGDVLDIAGRLLDLAEAPADAQARAGELQRRARDRHDVRVVGAALSTCYREVLTGRTC